MTIAWKVIIPVAVAMMLIGTGLIYIEPTSEPTTITKEIMIYLFTGSDISIAPIGYIILPLIVVTITHIRGQRH